MKIRSIQLGLMATGFIIMFNACKKSDPAVIVPSVSTVDITNITTIGATGGGVVNGDGGSAVTTRGICYATHAFPGLQDSVIISGSGGGTGQFAVEMISLDAGTLYFVRAFATNSIGTSYGEQKTFSTTDIAIGDNYKGGKVAYILQPSDPGYSGDKQKGLIASPADQTAAIWGAPGVTGATSTSFGFGSSNTDAIISVIQTGTYAARLCYDLTLVNYSDWYLPSVAEMNVLFLSKDIVGGYTGSDYWTSSEYNSTIAWSYDLVLGSGIANDKSLTKSVRAVRSF